MQFIKLTTCKTQIETGIVKIIKVNDRYYYVNSGKKVEIEDNTFVNKGQILEANGYALNIDDSISNFKIKNNGIISGVTIGGNKETPATSPSVNFDNLGKISNETNGVVIYSNTTEFNNYGIITAGETGIVVDYKDTATNNGVKNYGIIKDQNGIHVGTDGEKVQIDGTEYTIKNAVVTTSKLDGENVKYEEQAISMSGNTYDKHIINGLSNTLNISGNNTITSSIINAEKML